MTDVTPDTNPQTPDQEGPRTPGFRILTQYVKDLSFENPRAPESLRTEGKPNIEMGVEMGAQGRGDGLFEIDLKITINAVDGDKPVFNVELVYGGLFQLFNVSEREIEPMLLIECPRFLFPYARQIIGAATADGGFYPPFMLDPIDFAAIYAQRQAQVAQGADSPIGQA